MLLVSSRNEKLKNFAQIEFMCCISGCDFILCWPHRPGSNAHTRLFRYIVEALASNLPKDLTWNMVLTFIHHHVWVMIFFWVHSRALRNHHEPSHWCVDVWRMHEWSVNCWTVESETDFQCCWLSKHVHMSGVLSQVSFRRRTVVCYTQLVQVYIEKVPAQTSKWLVQTVRSVYVTGSPNRPNKCFCVHLNIECQWSRRWCLYECFDIPFNKCNTLGD